MRKIIILVLLISVVLISCSHKAKKGTNELRIYAYDSFVSWGLGKQAIPAFEKKYNCKVVMTTVGDAGALLNRLIVEKNTPKADIAVGIDNSYLSTALQEDLFMPYSPTTVDSIDKTLLFDKSMHLVPYDYGYFAFVYDTNKIKNPPQSFTDLCKPEWKQKIILIDPRTSSPGKGLLLWSVAAFGEKGFEKFWKDIKPNVLTITASWDEAYNSFLAGEAPIVLSYATSPAYHIETEKTTRYQAFIPTEGGYRQIEGAGILKGCNNEDLAKKFMDFMLTQGFQKHVPTTQWMFPVNNNISLPASFSSAPKPTRDLSSIVNNKNLDTEKYISKWISIMIQ